MSGLVAIATAFGQRRSIGPNAVVSRRSPCHDSACASRPPVLPTVPDQTGVKSVSVIGSFSLIHFSSRSHATSSRSAERALASEKFARAP